MEPKKFLVSLRVTADVEYEVSARDPAEAAALAQYLVRNNRPPRKIVMRTVQITRDGVRRSEDRK